MSKVLLLGGGGDVMMLARGSCELSSCTTCNGLSGTDLGTIFILFPTYARCFNSKLKPIFISFDHVERPIITTSPPAFVRGIDVENTLIERIAGLFRTMACASVVL